MRTKTTLAAAAILAAGLASTMANVVSLNVVGYVNTTIDGDGTYNLLCNPLNNTGAGGNNSTTLFNLAHGAQAVSAQILTWDVVAFDFDVLQPSFDGATWTANVSLPPGKGFFYVNAGATFVNTFVGDVVQGPYLNPITGDGSYNCIGSSAPIGGSFLNSIQGLVSSVSDQVLKWDKVAFDFDPTQPSYDGVSWSTALTIGVGEGLFYVSNGSGVQNWTRNFTVP